MLKRLSSLFAIFFIALTSLTPSSALALTPTLFVNQEIHFGALTPVIGSCLMIATTGALTSFTGQFLCISPDGSHNGNYTITANPNKIVQIKILPNLDNGNGVVFNARAYATSDNDAKGILNNTNFVEINSGTSGVINIDLGGELIISSIFPSGQTINFSFDAAIVWNEIN